MTVGEWIEQLKKFDPKLIVCLADWNEEYARPREDVAERLTVTTEPYYNRNGEAVTGQFLEVGSRESWRK